MIVLEVAFQSQEELSMFSEEFFPKCIDAQQTKKNGGKQVNQDTF